MKEQNLQLEQFEWDHWNANKIRNKHSVESYECEEVFFNRSFISVDELHSKVEQRFHVLGVTNSGRLLFAVFTIRGKKIRVISARNMSNKERREYEKRIKENSVF